MSSRFMSIVGFVVLSITSVACYVQPGTDQDTGNTKSAGAFGKGSTNGGTTAASEGGATCDAACGHYLECKGTDNAQNRATCTKSCEGMKVTEADLQSFIQSDCQTAIATVEGNGQQQQGSSSGGSAKGSECNGCVRDGDSCIWLSQSNWGQGPYSGAASSCEAYCCQ